MNEFYNVLTEHDDVLDGLENSIIAVNLPDRQAVYMIDRDDADLLAEARDTLRHKTTFW